MPAQKLTKNIVSETPTFIISADLGYGYTKLKCGDTCIVFPSVAAHATRLKFGAEETLLDYPGEQITDTLTHQEWFVGDLAVAQTRSAEQMQLKGRSNDPAADMRFRLRQLLVGIAKMVPHQHGRKIRVILATGLPVDHMSDSGLMKSTFIGEHPVKTNNADMVVEIDICYVMPQPLGTIYKYMYLPNGEINEEYGYETVAVFDIGRLTLDGTVNDKGKFINDRSGSIEGGVHIVQDRLIDLYNEKYGEKPSHKMLENILRHRGATIQNKWVDLSEMVEEAVAPLRDLVLSFMSQLWGKALEINVIFLTGGGAELVWDAVRKVYPHAILVDDSQMSNAVGYLNYAHSKNR